MKTWKRWLKAHSIREGRKGQADVPVHYKAVHLTIHIKTEESDKRLQRLIDLVARYCPGG